MIETAVEQLLTDESLEIGRKAIEDRLIEWRNSGEITDCPSSVEAMDWLSVKKMVETLTLSGLVQKQISK